MWTSPRRRQARKKFPKARFYQDWREMLDKEAGNIDSVNVSTPDHMHAPMGVSAMQLGQARLWPETARPQPA